MNQQAMRLTELELVRPSTSQHADIRRAGGPIRFGDFMLLPSARTLLFRGKPVELGSRAFDLLVVLLRSRGEIVSKEAIVRYVWPTTIVEESNLRFQMATLRRALGECRDMIKTIAGRGYMLIADREPLDETAPEEAPNATYFDRPPRSGNTPSIFVIDGDSGVRDAICRLLRPFNVNVQAFASLAAASGSVRYLADERLEDLVQGSPK